MAATLDDIEAAIFAQLESLKTTQTPTAGAFAQVIRFAGEPQVTNDARAPLAPKGQTPCAMLAFEGEAFESETTALAQRDTGFVGRSTWRVWVITSDLTGDDAAVKGGVRDGLYAMLNAVVDALAGLWIPDLYDNARLRVTNTTPVRNKRGEYIAVVRVTADRFIDVPTENSDAELAVEFGVGIDIQGDPADPAANPISSLTILTTDD